MTWYSFVTYLVRDGRVVGPADGVLIEHVPIECQKELESPEINKTCDYPQQIKLITDANGMALINIPESRVNHFWKYSKAGCRVFYANGLWAARNYILSYHAIEPAP